MFGLLSGGSRDTIVRFGPETKREEVTVWLMACVPEHHALQRTKMLT